MSFTVVDQAIAVLRDDKKR